MKFHVLLVAILVTYSIHTEAYSRSKRYVEKRQKRQSSADQMVQNILQWLQSVYSQNSRRVRQGTLREYLPPANTDKPRPFQPGYPPAGGITPQPPFPTFTNPATGGFTAPEGYLSPENEVLPPEEGSGGGGGYVKPQPQPGFSLPTTGGPSNIPSESSSPTYSSPFPGEPSIPTEKPSYPSELPGPFPTYPGQTEGQQSVTTLQPGYPGGSQPSITTLQPGYPDQPEPSITTTLHPGYPSGPQPSVTTTQHPGYPGGPEPSVTTTLQPGYPGGQPTVTTSQPGFPIYTSPEHGRPGISEGAQSSVPPYTSQPEGTHPPPQSTTGYPVSSQPASPGFSIPQSGLDQPFENPGYPTQPPAKYPTSTLQPLPPGPSVQPGLSTSPPIEGSTFTPPQPSPEGPSATDSDLSITPEPEKPGPGSFLPSVTTLAPSGFTSSPSTTPENAKPEGENVPAESEGSHTTLNPEVNTIPGKPEPSVVDEEELKHPPHIHAIDVQCGKEMMTINIEFNREFNGVIYSKGYYNMPECRYVQENSGQTKYTFTVNLNMCGTEFVNAFDTQNQSYLENILVLQNEPGIQEVWDTIRSVRCLWEGSLKDTLSVAFSIGMLSQEIVTFSGDTAMAKLDVVLGRGPFGEPANGLVKIGEPMTLVVSVSGDPGFDLQVKDCKAIDATAENSVPLTDDDGCILKPKLFGAFQKTRDTGSTGASIIAYAYFNAFKFPDVMDLMIECNIELCKTDCDMCSKDNQQLEPAKRRKRDIVSSNSSLADGVIMGKHLRVILPEDLNEKLAIELHTRDNVCMSLQGFVFSSAILVTLLVLSSFTSVCLWLKRGERRYLK